MSYVTRKNPQNVYNILMQLVFCLIQNSIVILFIFKIHLEASFICLKLNSALKNYTINLINLEFNSKILYYNIKIFKFLMN